MIAAEDKKTALKEFMEKAKSGDHPESQLIAILHRAQELYGHLDQAVMDDIALTMNIPTAHIWGVATFYHYFNLKPKGKHSISVCLGTACYVKGAAQVLETVKKELKIDIGETTQDGMFTLTETRCLGTCGLAPVMMIDDKVYGALTPKKTVEIIQSFYKK
ncbi:NADP-reducing hydrogenase HdnA [Candidatus Velamenicoccus archaeovorus]|uniref:NADP-reducing hydrogenase HdnA n=1 Tax=Velamenicoccus archaeovorus TaxID=1930593 RepID=A0A410P3B6_VELA1|nr:NADH-quinone oxidoreductase subunit NuoE [Candidatus Velamenicoccus archaeovorus]QAT16592.1 NADP-reducing hydrogenase HdnA [Candidatus Velamenicoccus archaeovorus]